VAEPPKLNLEALLYQPSLVHQLKDAESRDALQQIAERASALKALESQIIARLVFDRSQSAQSNFPHLLTAKQLAEHLAVPESWVREQARIGALPSIKLGHYVRFRLDDVQQYLHKPVVMRLVNATSDKEELAIIHAMPHEEETWHPYNDATKKTVLVETADVISA
jgi:excisionase family DNA binding protein